MACHPALLDAARDGIARCGFGAGASRLISGTFPEHLALESALARLVGLETALLLPSGYQANLAVITALATSSDLIVADRAVHASLIDAIRLSRAKLALYPHLDVPRARRLLATFGQRARRRFLVTESLFSMDGDIAPLPELADLAAHHDATFLVDEAHALGVLGPRGSGLCAELGVRPDILVGTLGKAFGSSGAFIAGNSTLHAHLINNARSFIFTTAVPVAVAAVSLASVELAISPEGEELRAKLHSNVHRLRALLALSPCALPSPILPILMGPDHLALEASQALSAGGFFVPAIRPPTVREGTSRLRISLSAEHSTADIESLAAALTPLLPPSRRPPAPAPPRPAPGHPPIPAKLPTFPRSVVILGTDTAVGKSTVAAALLHLLSRRGLRVVPFKPVETGADPEPRDALRLLAAAQRRDLPLDVICPYRFPLPLAPLAAAEQAGATITLSSLLAAATEAARHGEPLVVETAGGVLSPYGEDLTSADLATALGSPILLVARNALGTVNHTALAIAELRRRRLPILGIVLVDTAPAPTRDHDLNAGLITRLVGLAPLGILPFVASPDPALLTAALEASVDLRPILRVLT